MLNEPLKSRIIITPSTLCKEINHIQDSLDVGFPASPQLQSATDRFLSDVYLRRIMEILVNSTEASLLTAFRRLPPDAAGELSRLIERLAALAPERKIDWSDSWSDEDLKEFRAASVQRLEGSESEEVI